MRPYALFAAVLFLPFWISAIIGTVCLFLFRSYYEYIAFFFLSDLLYGTPLLRFHDFVFLTTAGSIVIFIIVEQLKKRMLQYQ